MSDTTTPHHPTPPVRTRSPLAPTLVVVGVVGIALTGIGGSAVAGQVEQAPAAITTTPIGPRSQFTDDVAAQLRFRFDGRERQVVNLNDARGITTVEITIPPGAVFPWHTHPAPVVINVAQGEFVYRLAEDCIDREYSAGEALVDAGGDNVHTAYNPGTTDTTVIATVLGAPADGPLTIPVDGPDPAVCPLPAP